MPSCPPPFSQGVNNTLAGFTLNTFAPIVTVDHIVRSQGFEVGHVVQGFLRHYLSDTLKVLNNFTSLFKRHVWNALVASDCSISQ